MGRRNTKKTTDEFIKDARAVYGDRYDYSKVEYNGNKVKVEIICPEHGAFFQAPAKHLSILGWCDIKRMVFSPFFFYLINQRFYGMIDDMEVVEMI